MLRVLQAEERVAAAAAKVARGARDELLVGERVERTVAQEGGPLEVRRGVLQLLLVVERQDPYLPHHR